LVSWKGAVVLVAVLAALGIYLLATRPQPAPAAAALVPCDVVKAVWFRVQSPSGTVEVERANPTSPWHLVQPPLGEADQNATTTLVNALDVLKVENTIGSPQALSVYGLDPPRELVSCRLSGGSSYNLSVGSRSFDGSGYYAQKGGDHRVYVVASVAVQQFDQALAQPPVKPTPSP
jgi:hypothetical protein